MCIVGEGARVEQLVCLCCGTSRYTRRCNQSAACSSAMMYISGSALKPRHLLAQPYPVEMTYKQNDAVGILARY